MSSSLPGGHTYWSKNYQTRSPFFISSAAGLTSATLRPATKKNITNIFLIAWKPPTRERLAIFSCLLSVFYMRMLNVYPAWKNHSHHENIFSCPHLIYRILRLYAACTNPSLQYTTCCRPCPLKPVDRIFGSSSKRLCHRQHCMSHR